MTGGLRFAVQYPDCHDPAADMLDAAPLDELVGAADVVGFDGFGLTDHPAPGAGWLAGGGHQTLDPLVALGHVAAVTRRLRLMTTLLVAPYRNPMVLAKAAMTVDKLSGGRLILGLGTGYLKSEFFAVGVDFDERNRLMDETLYVPPRYFSGEPFDYTGRHFSARNTQGLPRPVQATIPIWLGGNSDRTLTRVAEQAHGWMPMIGSAQTAATARTPHIDSLDELIGRLAVLRERAGDRFAGLDIMVGYPDPSILDLSSDIDRHRHTLAELDAAGVTWVLVARPRVTTLRRSTSCTHSETRS